jgi:hypothetical protein
LGENEASISWNKGWRATLRDNVNFCPDVTLCGEVIRVIMSEGLPGLVTNKTAAADFADIHLSKVIFYLGCLPWRSSSLEFVFPGSRLPWTLSSIFSKLDLTLLY